MDQALARARSEKTLGAYASLSNAMHKAPNGADFKALKLAVLRNFTVEPLLPPIEAEFALSGFRSETYLGDFDAIAADVFDSESRLFASQPELIIIALWLETLAPNLTRWDVRRTPPELDAAIEAVVEQLATLMRRVREHSTAPIVINNFPLVSRSSLGILDAQDPAGQTQALLTINRRLLEICRTLPDVFVADYFCAFAELGYANAIDERYWHKARAPLGQKVLLPLAQVYGTMLRALKGRAKKCLVLDCDNTLWGGILGEDGFEGLELGATYPGSCFRDFQREILTLQQRGVLIALCSKNNEADVMNVLASHPGMLLRQSHLAAWQINWDDKATNIERIVNELNIGIDSVVFVDDSEFELEWVQARLPAVRTLAVPKDVSRLRAILLQDGLFDTLSYSHEDGERTRLYADERQRKQLAKSAVSLQDYLASLELEASIDFVSEADVVRVAQLTQKTNQFNLTTRRYSESDIRRFIADPQCQVLCLRLKDRIAEMGLVAVAIIKYGTDVAEIDTFLMSCRVLGRGVEDALLAHVLKCIRAQPGIRTATGTYVATARNQQVEQFYERRGFSRLTPAGEFARWGIEVAATREYPDWIRVHAQPRLG